ncbi:MAG: hypothetical protein Q8P22_12545 [Chloroflexota bacterium]|nr:hypothetical protein [Chloroflexota bacterium]
MHDLIEFEKLGIPATAIVTVGFDGDATHSAKAFGLPNLPFVLMPYTLTSRTPDQIRGDMDPLIPGLIKALTTQPPTKVTIDTLVGTRGTAREKFVAANGLEAWEVMNREFLDREWGDGFPLIPPTPQKVEAMLRGVNLEPSKVLGILPPGNALATVEKIAINAVMAGCEPEQLPVLIAAVQTIIETPQDELAPRTIAMSTSPHTFVMLVNGPIIKRIGLNYGRCTLGPGKPGRVNTAIGRAVRLVLMNVGHCWPGRMDMDTIGSPTKYSMCLAENEDANPWEPFHVERGFDREQSTVTVFGITDWSHVVDYNHDPEQSLLNWSSRFSADGGNGLLDNRLESSVLPTRHLMVLSPDNARVLASRFTKRGIREFIAGHAETRVDWALAARISAGDAGFPEAWRWLLNVPPDTRIPSVPYPESISIIVVGGPTGKNDYSKGVRLSRTREIDCIAGG